MFSSNLTFDRIEIYRIFPIISASRPKLKNFLKFYLSKKLKKIIQFLNHIYISQILNVKIIFLYGYNCYF